MKKKIFNGLLQILGIMIVGAIIGYSVGKIVGDSLSKVDTPNSILLLIAGVLAFILHIIVHEAGHLFFGLLSGYKFISFRAFDFKIIKDENGKLKVDPAIVKTVQESDRIYILAAGTSYNAGFAANNII